MEIVFLGALRVRVFKRNPQSTLSSRPATLLGYAFNSVEKGFQISCLLQQIKQRA